MKPVSQVFTLLLLLTCIATSSKYAHSYYDYAHSAHATPWPLDSSTNIEQEFELAGALTRTLTRTAKEAAERAAKDADAAKKAAREASPQPVPGELPLDAPSGHVVDPNNEVSVRKSFIMSGEGQEEISSVIQNQEIQIAGIDHQLFFTRSVPISQLSVDDQGRLIALFKGLVNDLPEEAFKSSDSLTKAMRERLEKQLAESSSQAAPRYKFDVSSGKLTLPRLGRVGSLEISGGELDTYKLLQRIALVAIACGVTGCDCFVAALFGVESKCVGKLTRP